MVTLAGQCPRVRILTTSRERLDVPGELVFPVPPLETARGRLGRCGRRSEAGHLFVARACAASPGFTLTKATRPRSPRCAPGWTACRWPSSWPRPGARRSGPGSSRPAWRAIRGCCPAARPGRDGTAPWRPWWPGAIELLGEAERRLLARLSVLRGGFDLEVAEQVAGGEPLAPAAVAGLLASLAGKSLVQVQAGPVVRYSLLETVRQFAASGLAASGEEAAVHARLLQWALEIARSAEAAPPGPEGTSWSSRLSAGHASIRAALSWALGVADPEAGRELAARLARWWIATGRYSEAGQFLTAAAEVPSQAAPGIRARVLLGAAWSAYHLGDFRRSASLAADGIVSARQAGEPPLEAWGRNLLAGLAWHAGDADRIVAEIEASRALSGQADPALAARAQVLLATAAFLAGDLAEQDRRGRLAIELARTAAGQEGLALALTTWTIAAIGGAGIQPAMVAALDEAANLLAAHPDRFTETIMRCCRAWLFATLGQLEAAETEVGLCWAAGRSGAVRPVEFLGPLAEARLAAARGDTATAAAALRRAADGGRRVASVMYVPATLAGLACLAAIAGDESTAAAAVGEARAELGGRRQAITAAALALRRGRHGLAPGRTRRRRAPVREAAVQWHRGGDQMGRLRRHRATRRARRRP